MNEGIKKIKEYYKIRNFKDELAFISAIFSILLSYLNIQHTVFSDFKIAIYRRDFAKLKDCLVKDFGFSETIDEQQLPSWLEIINDSYRHQYDLEYFKKFYKKK